MTVLVYCIYSRTVASCGLPIGDRLRVDSAPALARACLPCLHRFSRALSCRPKRVGRAIGDGSLHSALSETGGSRVPGRGVNALATVRGFIILPRVPVSVSPPPLLPLPSPARVRPSPPRVSSLFVNRRALLPVNPACTYYVEEQDRANPPDLKTNLPHRPPVLHPVSYTAPSPVYLSHYSC